jgi:hypothetical protein
VFFTASPDDTHSVLAIRCSYPTKDPTVFPTVDGELTEKLSKGDVTLFEESIDISEFGLQALIAENPVAAARDFKFILETIFIVLLGIYPEYMTKSTRVAGTERRGIFGTTKAAFSCIETQARLSLHAHIAIWTAITPNLIQDCAQFKDLLSEIKIVLSSYVRAHIPAVFHLKALAHLATPPKARSYEMMSRTPEYWSSLNYTLIYSIINAVCIHEHCFTCHKGPNGVNDHLLMILCVEYVSLCRKLMANLSNRQITSNQIKLAVVMMFNNL